MVGTIGGGKAKPTGKIDIAVMQSVSRQGEVNPLVENYGQVIVDECHHVGAVSFDAILKRTKAKYVLGLTATPIRRDGQQPIIFMQCGPIRHTAATPAGAPHDLEVVPRSRHSSDRSADRCRHPGRVSASRQRSGRTDAIAAEVREAVAQGRKVLVLTERTEHLDAIKAELDSLQPAPFVLHGRMSRKQRATLVAELDALPPDAPRVLLSTGKLVGEGFDHPPLDTWSSRCLCLGRARCSSTPGACTASTPARPTCGSSTSWTPAIRRCFPNGKSQKTMTSIRSPQQLGDALRAARKQLGLTQPQLALAAGVGVRFIVDLEAGKPTLRLENVLRVIDALGGEIQLCGLPSVAADDQREGGDHGA